MRVILRENVENLGRIGDIVNASDGYVRNFLLPRNLVTLADEKNQAALEHQKRQLERKRQAEKMAAEEVAKKLSEVSCTIKRKVGEKDKLFGSVSAADIAQALKVSGVEVARRDIHLSNPIKNLGVHEVTVKLESDVTASVKVWVVKEE